MITIVIIAQTMVRNVPLAPTPSPLRTGGFHLPALRRTSLAGRLRTISAGSHHSDGVTKVAPEVTQDETAVIVRRPGSKKKRKRSAKVSR